MTELRALSTRRGFLAHPDALDAGRPAGVPDLFDRRPGYARLAGGAPRA